MIRTPVRTTSVVAISRVEVDGRDVPVPVTLTFADEGGSPRPGIVLFPEIFGINKFILDTARDLARRGFIVAIPDLYHRTGTAPLPHQDVRRAMKMALTITPETSEIDTDAAIALLRSHPDVAGDRLAAIGYCVGGLLSYASTARRPGVFRASVVFYANGLMGTSPHPAWRDDLLLDLGPADAPVRMFYGGQDDHISTDYVHTVDGQLQALGVDVETVIYEDAGHGFCNSQLPTFNASAAQDAWLMAMNFLA
jgi:carboxymethylenebutenolidase